MHKMSKGCLDNFSKKKKTRKFNKIIFCSEKLNF